MTEEKIKNNIIINKTIKKEMHHLLAQFIEIRNLGYIKSTAKGTAVVGITFENYLGKKADSYSIPDYHGIEIKTKRAYSKSYITLFGMSPNGITTNEANRLLENYGYTKKNSKNKKCLYSEVICNALNSAGIKYYFKLRLDYSQKSLFLQVYNQQKQLIEESIYWNFSDIQIRLYNKLTYLAYILAWPKIINGEEYFKYYSIKFYVLKDFSIFLDLLEKGHIKIIIALTNTSNSKFNNRLSSHKISFAINPEYLSTLFYLYNIKNDLIT